MVVAAEAEATLQALRELDSCLFRGVASSSAKNLTCNALNARDRGANGAQNGANGERCQNGANGKKRRKPGAAHCPAGHKRGKGAAKRECAAHGACEPSVAQQDEGDGKGVGTQ